MCYILSIVLYGAETWTLGEVDQNYLESFVMWCWRRMEKISLIDGVKNEEVLEESRRRGNPTNIKIRKANWIGHIWHRNCLIKHVIEEKIEGTIEMTGRQGRRRKQLLVDLKEKGGYYELKEEAVDRTVWRTRVGRGYGPVVRQRENEWMNIYICTYTPHHLTVRLYHKQPSISAFEPFYYSYETLCNYYAIGYHCKTIILISHSQ
jgi:hypothetical protein